ncbi:MAG: UPF0182 family protein, partial [Anaerolineae bacterium]|nr:UPF0182 family protein [Anaerolineae bacterium]
MNQKARRLLVGMVFAFAALVLLPLLSGNAITFYTDWLWFDSVGQLGVLRTRILARVVLWVAGVLVVAAFLAVNWFFLPRRLLGRFQLRIRRQGGASFTVGARVLTILLSVIGALVALTMASSAAGRW